MVAATQGQGIAVPAGSSESEARADVVVNADQGRSDSQRRGVQARAEALSAERWREFTGHRG